MFGVLITKFGLHGGFSAIGSMISIGMRASVILPVLNKEVPLWAFSFGIGGLSSLISDAVHTFVSKEIHLSKKAEDEVSTFLSVGISALVFYQAINWIDPQIAAEYGMYKAYLIGGISEYLSTMAVNLVYHM